MKLINQRNRDKICSISEVSSAYVQGVSQREIVRLFVADCCQSSMLQSIGGEDYQCLVCYKKFLNYEKISLENEKNVVNIHKLHYLNFEILN